MNVLESLDRFVRATGLYGLTMIERPEPRNLRWLPLLLIACFIGGYACSTPAFGMATTPLAMMTGGLVFYLAFGASFYLRYVGPPLVAPFGEGLDERERMLKARATAASGHVVAGLAMFACFYFALASLLGWWWPGNAVEWAMLGIGVQGVHFTLPVLFASWMQPRLDAEG
jgi:hypothetical protein